MQYFFRTAAIDFDQWLVAAYSLQILGTPWQYQSPISLSSKGLKSTLHNEQPKIPTLHIETSKMKYARSMLHLGES